MMGAVSKGAVWLTALAIVACGSGAIGLDVPLEERQVRREGSRVVLAVAAADYSDRWPLTVDSGDLICEPVSRVIFRHAGTEYAVNGMATSADYADIDPIWAAGDTAPKKNIGPLLNDGLELCDR